MGHVCRLLPPSSPPAPQGYQQDGTGMWGAVGHMFIPLSCPVPCCTVL